MLSLKRCVHTVAPKAVALLREWLWRGLSGCMAILLSVQVWAQVPNDVQVARESEGLFLTATLPPMVLSAPVQAALHKGIPMYFTLQARVLRQRWYWSDQVLASAYRYVRLSYQPLTRRWRVAQSSQPLSDGGLGLSTSVANMGLVYVFDGLPDALAALQRIARWKIAEANVAKQSSGYTVDFQLRLDVSQLPRLLQIGTAGHQGWMLQLKRSVRVPPLEGLRTGLKNTHTERAPDFLLETAP